MLRHMLSGADIVLVSQLPEVVDIVVPSKMLTALAAGSMIVAACAPGSEAARLIMASGGGLVIPPSDEGALVDVIHAVQCGAVDSQAFRKKARDYAIKAFGRDEVFGRIVRELDRELPA